LAGRAGARTLSALTVFLSLHTALRALLRLALPARPVPRVPGVDDFALRKRSLYATVLIDAETRQRIDVLPDRQAATLDHGCVPILASKSCAGTTLEPLEAIRRALPGAVQVGDRWHIWNNLGVV